MISQKKKKIALALRACNFVVFEKLTRAYLHQIAREIMLLPTFKLSIVKIL